MSVTIDIVAEMAGVSKATVSRFLNNRGQVSPKTAETITRVIRELDYVPNSAARSLVLKRTDRIGLIIGSVGHPFWSILYDNIVQRVSHYSLRNERFETLTISIDRIVLYNSIKNIRDKIKVMVEERVTGMILAVRESLDKADIEYLRTMDIPCVIIQCEKGESRISHVSIDNFKASYEAASYLAGLGHKNIAYVSGPPGTTFTDDRFEGYRQAMIDKTRQFNPDWVLRGNNTYSDGYWRMKQILSWPVRPTAVMFANDHMAYGAMKAAAEQGLSIPEDLSIMGFDGLDVENEFFSMFSNLTTVHQPIRAIGAKAVDTIMKMIKDKAAGNVRNYTCMLATDILERGSCRRLD